jgi:hypothetical protein
MSDDDTDDPIFQHDAGAPTYPELAITDRTRKTCQLINLIVLHDGRDMSADVDRLIAEGADITVRIPTYMSTTDCTGDDYDDFRYTTRHTWQDPFAYYPVVFALRHFCHPAVVRTLAAYSAEHPPIHRQITKECQELFSQLYRNPYFSARADNPNTYHHRLRALAAEYLAIFGLTPAIFDDCPPHKQPRQYRCNYACEYPHWKRYL